MPEEPLDEALERLREQRAHADIGSFCHAQAWLYGGSMLACAAALAAIAPLTAPASAVGAGIAIYAALALMWSRDAVAHCETILNGAGQRTAAQARLVVVSAALGAVWGLVPLLLSGSLGSTQLQLYSACLMLVCVSFSASVTALPWVVHAFVASAVLPLASAWLWREEAGKVAFGLALALAWLASALVNQRSLVMGRRARGLARSRENLARDLAQRVRLLREAHAAKERALNVASHEIRQPIHAIGLLVERLRSDPQAWPLRPQIDEISGVVHSVSSALELLLDIARLDAGSVSPAPSTFSVRDLLQRLAVEFEPAAAHKGLRLECLVGPQTWIRTDPLLLHSILANLVSNAIRYTDRGKVVLSWTPRNAQQIWIHVADTGLGIPLDSRHRIFEEFYRVSRENQSTQGFGLGLAIVRRTARLLGLEIEVDSAPAKGSRFSVSAPVADASLVGAATVPAVAAAPSVGRTLVGMRCLLIENDQVVLKGMEAMVRTWGCRPLVATGLDDLKAKLAHQEDMSFDFILADYHLGTGAPNGLEVIRLVRMRAGRPVAAALLTGDLNIRSGALADDAQVHLLHKPVAPAKLRNVIERMVAERAQRSEANPSAGGIQGNVN